MNKAKKNVVIVGFTEIEKHSIAIPALSANYYESQTVHYVNSLSTEDISLLLKIPKGTVLSRLYKARLILKKELEKDGL